MGSHFGKGSSRNPAAGTDTEIAREQTKMRVAIEPRKAIDRGGYYCMPLKVNVPTGRNDWKLTKCPECGAQCWELPLAEVAKAQGAKGLCTMCALKKGVGGR